MDDRNEEFSPTAKLRRKILERIDLKRLRSANSESAREEVLLLIRSLINSEPVPLSFAERERLARQILDEIFGLGPLEQLLQDHTVSEILVRRFDRVYVERNGEMELTDRSFADTQHLTEIIERIISNLGRHIDESSPMVDAWLADGSRVNAVIPPPGNRWSCSVHSAFW